LAPFDIKLAAVKAIMNKANPIVSLEFFKISNFEIFMPSFYWSWFKKRSSEGMMLKPSALLSMSP
jgi:hypothetical protein